MAKFPDANAISCRLNGTPAAKSVKVLNAAAPSSALPNKNLKRSCNDSTSLPTLTRPLTNLTVAIPANATPANVAALPKDINAFSLFFKALPKLSTSRLPCTRARML